MQDNYLKGNEVSWKICKNTMSNTESKNAILLTTKKRTKKKTRLPKGNNVRMKYSKKGSSNIEIMQSDHLLGSELKIPARSLQPNMASLKYCKSASGTKENN